MKYVIELFIWISVMFMNLNINMCHDIGVRSQGAEEAAITSLGTGAAVDGRFEGIWGDKESRYYKLTIPENKDSKWIALWMANYADSPVRCSLIDENGRIVDEEIKVPANRRKIIPVRAGDSIDKESPYRLQPGRTYYIKIEKQFFSARGRYIISVFDILDNGE